MFSLLMDHDRLENARIRIERHRAGELPPDVPPFTTLALACTWFANRQSFAHVTLELGPRGVICDDPRSRIRLLHRPWHAVTALAVEREADVLDRLAELRSAAVGLLTPRRAHVPERALVIVSTTALTDLFFEVSAPRSQVAGVLAPVTEWFGRHETALHEL
jgi:hypothetical protein